MRIKSVVALMCIGLILIMCGCRETREKLSVEEYFYKDGMGVDREPEMEAGGKIKQEYVSEDKEKEISENKTVLYIYDGLNGNKTFDVADGLFCREIDGLFCRSSPDIIVRRRCVLSHKRRGWLQPSPSFRYSRNLALQDELYHPVINNGPAVLVCVDKRLGTGPVNQSRDAG